MNIKNLQDRVKDVDATKTRAPREYTEAEKDILTKTIKLNEEVGELCNDVLSVLKLQRKSKLERFEKRNFYEEFADVIITTMQLANSAGVDIERALSDKLKKIDARRRKDK
jgi:NTP pyrophosphatase (non-canonical NTP hydrolase)